MKLLIANRVPAQDSEKEYAGSLVNITKEQAIEEYVEYLNSFIHKETVQR